ncbi:MAG: phosphotransferase [Gammaproteobacteria bacterium]
MDFDALYDRPIGHNLNKSALLLNRVAAEMGCRSFQSVTRLQGGFNNFNYHVITKANNQFIIRISPTPKQLSSELCALRQLKALRSNIPVPEVLWHSNSEWTDGFSVAAISFVEGTLLSKMGHTLSEYDVKAISEQLGTIAADIHSITFSDYGFLDENFHTKDSQDNYTSWTFDFLSSCLSNALLRERLGDKNCALLENCITEHQHLLEAPRQPVLCHGDFNQKNILITKNGSNKRYTVTAILDWEYALAGSAVMDIGNLFRYADRSDTIHPGFFASAYKEAKGHLSPHWQDQSRFTDLLALCAFLISPEQRPATYAHERGNERTRRTRRTRECTSGLNEK